MNRDSVTPTVDTFPGDKAKEWVEYYNKHGALSTHSHPFVWDTSEDAIGAFCTDVDGNVLMDFTNQIAANPFGYNNPKIMDKMEEFNLVEPSKIAGQSFRLANGNDIDDPDLPSPAHLTDRLTDITGYGMDTVFLSNSGAEAVENALKISYDYRDGKYAITFDNAFHGRTLGVLSLNRSKGKYRRNFPEISSVESIPYCDDRTCTQKTCKCGFFSQSHTSQLRRLLGENGSMDPEEVSYIILEPIQGEGGYQIPSSEFMREIGYIRDEYNIPLIIDEVQAGLGRTGEWWGVDNYEIVPDVISAAKPVRVGATIAREEMFPDTKGRISSTWGNGDILSSALGVATIDAIEEHNILDHVKTQGRNIVERITERDLDHIVDIRGKGLMIGVEFDTKDHRDEVVQNALQRGLVLLGCGEKTIRILPPLDVTDREIDVFMDLFEPSVNEL